MCKPKHSRGKEKFNLNSRNRERNVAFLSSTWFCTFILATGLNTFTANPPVAPALFCLDLSSCCGSLPLWQRETFYPRLLNETLPSSAADRHNIASQHQGRPPHGCGRPQHHRGGPSTCAEAAGQTKLRSWRRLFQSRLSARDPTSC